MAGLGILAPLQNQGLPARQGQNQGGKHTRRAEAHHHRALFRGGDVFRRLIEGHRGDGGPLAAAGTENFLFVSVHRHVHGVDDLHVRLFPGVHAAADDAQGADFGIGNAQHLRRFKLKLVGIVLRGQGNIPQSNHSKPPACSPASLPELHAHCKL